MPKEPKNGGWSHKIFVLILTVIAVYLFYAFNDWATNLKLASKAIEFFGLITIIEIYKVFWLSRKNDVDKTIFSDSIGVAIYIGFLFLSGAVIFGLGN